MATADIELIRPDWPVPAHVHAVSTTRVGGCSSGPYSSLNLGLHVGDDPNAVEQNRRVLNYALNIKETPHWLNQVHGVSVVAAESISDNDSICADASITASAGTVCAIMTADCLPVLFTDHDGGCVAAVHGGWRGLVAGILENTVGAFAARGITSDKLIAWFGPAIGPDAYEIDVAVAGALRDDDRSALIQTDQEHWQLDLYALARLRLAACGVDAIFGGDLCTCSAPERFFSYRRDDVCGRQATLIWLD